MGFGDLRVRFFEALDREGGSISRAARVVGVNPATAFGWARKAGVRGRGKTGTSGHPGRAEYDRLRACGVRRRDAAAQVGVNERTARDWDRGIRKSGNARLHPDGRKIDYTTGMTSIAVVGSPSSLAAVDAELHLRFLTLTERELIADMRREGRSLRAIGRELGRPASTVKREVDARAVDGVYRPRIKRNEHGPRAGHALRSPSSPRTAGCAHSSRTSCGSGGHPNRSVTLWSSSSPRTRACG